MKRYSDRFLRITFFIERSSKLTREWFRGTMLYTRHNPKWFVRIFELGNGHDEELLDFGSFRPDGIIACGVPVRFLQRYFHERGMDDIPMMAFPQEPYPHVGTVHFDCLTIAQKAIELFRRRGCRHVVYVGTHLPNGVRLSRSFAKVFAVKAEKAGVGCTIIPRKVYSSIGIRVSECDGIMATLKKLPKPCGILTYVGGTLEITPEPPPTITIHIEQGEEITDVMDENGESVDEDLELSAGTTEVTLELEASGLTVPVFKVVRDNVTNVTTTVATYTIKDNDTLEFFAEEAEEDDPTVSPEQRKQAIIDAIDPPDPDDEEDVKRYNDAKAKVEDVVGEEADQVPAKDFAAYITKNGIKSEAIADCDYVAASVKLDTDDLITEDTEVEIAELVKAEGDALTFTVDIDSDPVNVEAIKDMVEASSDLTAWKDHILEVEATFEPGGEDEAGKVTITPKDPTDKAFMKVVIPQDPVK